MSAIKRLQEYHQEAASRLHSCNWQHGHYELSCHISHHVSLYHPAQDDQRRQMVSLLAFRDQAWKAGEHYHTSLFGLYCNWPLTLHTCFPWSYTPVASTWLDDSYMTAQGQVWKGEVCCHDYLPVVSWSYTSVTSTWWDDSYMTTQGQVWKGEVCCHDNLPVVPW